MCQNIFMIWGKEEFLKRETVSKTQKTPYKTSDEKKILAVYLTKD